MMKISINSASKEDLVRIIHIGAKLADKIIENRPIRSIEELDMVLGLGEIRMEAIVLQDMVSFDEETVEQSQINEVSTSSLNYMQAVRLRHFQ